MSDHGSNHSGGRTLDYASVPETPRGSLLAWAALVVAAISCPVVLKFLCDLIDEFMMGSSRPGPWYEEDRGLIYAGMIVLMVAMATTLSLVAIVRIRRSRGKLGSIWPAVIGLNLTVIWWGIIVAFGIIMFADMPI